MIVERKESKLTKKSEIVARCRVRDQGRNAEAQQNAEINQFKAQSCSTVRTLVKRYGDHTF